MTNKFLTILYTVFFIVVLNSCNEEEFSTNSGDLLTYSVDTVSFDTVFTTIGTVTKTFTIHNDHTKYITISSIIVEGGSSSNFQINVDGESGQAYSDITIPPNDSIYVFVQATIDPVNDDLPIFVYDAIQFEYNGNQEEVVLQAYGQDVHLIDAEYIETQTWEADKPYLIYNNGVVDSAETLTINEGVEVCLHDDASLVIYGTLKINGTLDNPVVFQGDRFDGGYAYSAGRWGTIYFAPESIDNEINYAIIKNASAGIQIGTPGDNQPEPDLLLRNTIIQNTTSASIIAFGANIKSFNCIFADSKYNSLTLLMGGDYNFYHATVSCVGAIDSTVSYQRYVRQSSSAVFLSNYYSPYYTLNDFYYVVTEEASNELVAANFFNSIIYGSQKMEFDTADNGLTDLNFYFDHCILRQTEDSIDISDAGHYNSVILNSYPRFVNDSATLGDLDYHLDSLSPAQDAGSLDIVNDYPEYLEYDYDGNLRTADGVPDLGAYEKVD